MNITTRVLLRHFLQRYHSEQSDPKVASIDPFFQSFFTKAELKDIVASIYDRKALEELQLNRMTKEQLLDAIGDDTIILGYVLARWEDESYRQASITAQAVSDTLEQLGLTAHYLGQKDIQLWDAYDLNNFRALQLKAGRIVRVYGIYDASIHQEELHSVSSSPQRLYESHKLAEDALEELTAGDQFHKEELHILSLHASS